MTGLDHYKQAQQILENVGRDATRLAARSDINRAEEQGIVQAIGISLQMAQVHATLAVAAAEIVTSREQFEVWGEVTQ